MTVLLVEDDTMVRLTLADFFDAAGLDFLEASNAEDALAILDDPSQPVDVLVTDINLGTGDSGLALAAKARQRRPKLLVIYETGSPETLAGRNFSSWERVFYKPFDPTALAATVSALNGPCRPGRPYYRPSAGENMASSL
ncbi:response regulator [Belnapia sp. T6]|uniref:Response regulator n=1 Tax=Belnapia mucosa TaxID=2804532 RepID=A0ABS1VB63_9PROT|nr:response regulator [Belnapia mucosa]MBL6458883.1 response regulator [Belnapia mucosa]